MTVSLILSPEVGVHYPSSGLPKDVISRPENVASHSGAGPIAVNIPPNAFSLPSLFAPEFTKRYYSFLSRMDNLLADLGRASPKLLESVEIVMTGSFWKYYRAPAVSARGPFSGAAGDYSSSAALAYRQRMEQFFGQREFSDPGPAAANRWKTRGLEETNRRWFYQQSEEVFRNRSMHQVRKKAAKSRALEIELFTPEADPSMIYSQFLQMVGGGHADFFRLSQLVDEMAARSSSASAGFTTFAPGLGPVTAQAAPYVHWSEVGGFRTLADSEKQFLILKSLLMMGGQGGGILIDENEWFSLSQTFRSRTEAFARLLAHGDLKLQNRALYLAPHLWSGAGMLWDELLKKLGPSARMVAAVDSVLREPDANLLIVDPSYLITQDTIRKLVNWAKGGRVVALPRSPLFTEAARRELDQLSSQTKSLEIDMGVAYRLYSMGDGSFIVYDPPVVPPVNAVLQGAWQTFLSAVLSVAEVQSVCTLGDHRLSTIPLSKRDGSVGLFVLNGTRRQVGADIMFPHQVAVEDLAIAVSASGAASDGAPKAVPASRFALEVPPCGILPLTVSRPRPAPAKTASRPAPSPGSRPPEPGVSL